MHAEQQGLARMTVSELLKQAEEQLQGIDSARLDAELLLAKCLGMDRAGLYLAPEREVDDELQCTFESLLGQRRERIPLAYLLEEKEFWSLPLRVNRHTLVPRPETELLVETSLAFIDPRRGVDVLDLGTGSGAIALALASERPAAKILALDRCEKALAVARDNAVRLGLANISFQLSSWFAALPAKQFEVIVCNPPYVESGAPGFADTELRHEPRLALDGGETGMDAIASLLPAARDYLSPGGRLFIEHGASQAAAVRELFAENNYRDIACLRDYAGLDRVSHAQRQ